MKLPTYHLFFSYFIIVWNRFYFKNQNIFYYCSLFPLKLPVWFSILYSIDLYIQLATIFTLISANFITAFYPFECVTIYTWQWMQFIVCITVLTNQVQLSPVMPITLKETFITIMPQLIAVLWTVWSSQTENITLHVHH